MKAHYLLIAALVALLAVLLFTNRAFSQTPEWVSIADGVRVTYYGSHYVGGEVTASGVRYMPDNDTVALGPYHLNMVRDWYGASTPAGPLRWWWEPSWELRYTGEGGCYPVPVNLHSARWWGCLIRLCAPMAEGPVLCREFRVADTGSSELEVDLPDETWAEWEYPVRQGVFTATLEVLALVPEKASSPVLVSHQDASWTEVRFHKPFVYRYLEWTEWTWLVAEDKLDDPFVAAYRAGLDAASCGRWSRFGDMWQYDGTWQLAITWDTECEDGIWLLGGIYTFELQ